MFFGTFAKSGSAAADALKALQNEASGEFEFDKVDGVFVTQHGNAWSGDFAYAIAQAGSAFTTHGGHSKAVAVGDAKPDAIKAAIATLGLSVDDFEPIGFYLYLDVW